MGRAAHELGLLHLATSLYQAALECESPSPVPVCWSVTKPYQISRSERSCVLLLCLVRPSCQQQRLPAQHTAMLEGVVLFESASASGLQVISERLPR